MDPKTYPALWQKVLSYFMSIRRIDVFTCLRKSTLIYCTKNRAIVSAPQQFLVAAGNNKSYQKVAAEAFAKVTGFPIQLHTVLKGGEEEASAFALLKSAMERGPAAPAPKTDDYRLVSRDSIPETDRNDPSLNEALKIMSDCDIYEKTES
ncbi:hypothetical protein [uncultured Dialister sp.]|uniref:hypothetical protein n=1 Tax=uncultured Dialister sp. TaxID=278064 RepID=UPI0026305AC6|nr:hypothetical protein [uncultured Dialister sp.]